LKTGTWSVGNLPIPQLWGLTELWTLGSPGPNSYPALLQPLAAPVLSGGPVIGPVIIREICFDATVVPTLSVGVTTPYQWAFGIYVAPFKIVAGIPRFDIYDPMDPQNIKVPWILLDFRTFAGGGVLNELCWPIAPWVYYAEPNLVVSTGNALLLVTNGFVPDPNLVNIQLNLRFRYEAFR